MGMRVAGAGRGREDCTERGPVTLRVTRLGWSVLALAVMLTSTALWHARPLGLGLACGFLAALILARYCAGVALAGLYGEWIPPLAPQAGEEVAIAVRLTAFRAAPPFALLAWQPMARRSEMVATLAGIERRPVRHRWTLRFPRRGLVTLPPLEAEVAMPFGLVAARGRISASATTMVLPVTGIVRRDLRDHLTRWLECRALSASPGDEELSHLRAYRPGDPPRRIHWPASARHRELLVAERFEPTSRRLALAIDTAVPREFARFENLISIAATLVEHLQTRDWTVSLHGAWLGPEGTEGNLQHLLTALALARIGTSPVVESIPVGRTCLVLAVNAVDAAGIMPEPLVLTLSDCEHLVRLPRRGGI